MRSLGMILAMQPRERCGHRDRGKGTKASKRPHRELLDGIFRSFPRLSLVMYLDTTTQVLACGLDPPHFSLGDPELSRNLPIKIRLLKLNTL